MRTIRLLMAVTVILYGTAGSVLAANPQKTLNQIKKVDGAGSGLDADTVRGQTPESIIATANSAVASASPTFSRPPTRMADDHRLGRILQDGRRGLQCGRLPLELRGGGRADERLSHGSNASRTPEGSA